MRPRLKILLSSSICVVSLSGVTFAGTLSHQTQTKSSNGTAAQVSPTVAFPISSNVVPNSSVDEVTYSEQLYMRDAQTFAQNPVEPDVQMKALDSVQTHAEKVRLIEIAAKEKAEREAKAKAKAKAKAEKLKAQHAIHTLSYTSHATLSSRGSSLASISGGGAGTRAAQIAEQYIGTPYSWGGASPSGFDCSGLVQYVYGKLGISLPHSSYADMNVGPAVSESHLQPGDLVFFATDGPGASHVGIYVGGGSFVSASGNHVQTSSLGTAYWGRSYIGARRP